MLSEKEIEALKAGAYGISRDGRKARYIGDNKNGSPVIARFCEDGTFVSTHIYTTSFFFSVGIETHLDIVGLWEDKPEPFNLERALEGAPIVFKGYKCFVYKSRRNNDSYIVEEEVNGTVWNFVNEEELNECEMWKEPEPVKQSVDDLPKPIREFGDLEKVWYIALDEEEGKYIPEYGLKAGGWSDWQYAPLNHGIYYASKEDCQAVCDWLMSR